MKRRFSMQREVGGADFLEEGPPETGEPESGRQERLLARKKDQEASGTMADPSGDMVPYECDICHKSFLVPRDAADIVCIYCGYHLESGDLEEVHHVSCGYSESVKSGLLERVREQSKRKDTWSDGRKEQLSLEMGSEEYLERVEDLKEHNPFRPDDEVHAELERRNADLVTKAYDTADENPYADAEDEVTAGSKQRQLEEQAKRSLHDKAVGQAIAAAAMTETRADDKLARSMKRDHSLLHDPRVKPKDYVEKLNEYVMEMTLE